MCFAMLTHPRLVVFGTVAFLQSGLFEENYSLRTLPYFSGLYFSIPIKFCDVPSGFLDGFKQVSL